MNPVPWKNPRIVYTLLFVFLSGAVAGAVTARFGMSSERHRPGPFWNEGGREISLQRFKKELDLTTQQAGEIESVLDDFVMYYQTLQAQMDDVRATDTRQPQVAAAAGPLPDRGRHLSGRRSLIAWSIPRDQGGEHP